MIIFIHQAQIADPTAPGGIPVRAGAGFGWDPWRRGEASAESYSEPAESAAKAACTKTRTPYPMARSSMSKRDW